MRKFALFALLSLTALAACGTPQERCVNRSTSEVRDLMKLRDEVDGNLARGYAWHVYQVPISRWEVCGYNTFRGRDGRIIERPRMCFVDDYVTRRRQVPIDPQSEARKRDALAARIEALTPQMNANVQACRAAYPE
ncbi:hypothetical protein [Paenirhodobacter populi]|uniref:Excinuclease ABC subunit B n=1 Tax=Paenirhodobacter populi TaxID=2306993 RepID=A0A443J003_9RHOB|nr:hypothetical protein [Sinirhodobacter populi]RWR13716.1 hypothetical protein D2T33_04780 [Sinirhodobacter populi]RWR19805.1 hypothetical protein D2T30_12620 [Sinirhodobacter populi]